MKQKDFLESGKRTLVTAGALVGLSKIISVLLRVAQKNPEVIKKFSKIAGGATVLIGGTWLLCYIAKNKSDASKYKSNREADGDMYTIESMADSMFASSRPKTPQNEVCNCDNNECNAPLEACDDRITWIESFKSRFTMPSVPSSLGKILKGVPAGYEEPMLLHLLNMYGAMCFSKVRAVYSDGVLHAPNLQVIVEGSWSSGKRKFEQVFKELFHRVIERGKTKIERMGNSSEEFPYIILTTGLGTSMPRYIDMLAAGQGCHMYMFNSEVRALENDMRKGNGITFDFLRKAFENGDVCRNNKAKDSKNGIFPLFLNYTITGTPKDIGDTFKKELEGGTLSRIAWACIPEAERFPGVLHMPEGDDLENLRDQIDDWTEKYCFRTDDSGDKAVDEVKIDLGYVCKALDEWNNSQYDQSVTENNPARKDARLRMATIAFHCAIVLHMLYDCPTDSRKKKDVANLTIFIANYCIERFLHKFGREQNEQRSKSFESELVQHCEHTEGKKKYTVKELKELHDILDEHGQHIYGWDPLGQMSGMPSSTVRRKVRKYEAGLKV